MTKMFLISLSGQGDTDLKLVTQEVWDWVLTPFNGKGSGYTETVPKAVQEEMMKHNGEVYEVNVTIGSYENDRALQAPGVSFRTHKELIEYVKKNSVEIVEEFDGYIY